MKCSLIKFSLMKCSLIKCSFMKCSLMKCRIMKCGLSILFKGVEFATNPNFLIPISLQPDGVTPYYFKIRLFDLT